MTKSQTPSREECHSIKPWCNWLFQVMGMSERDIRMHLRRGRQVGGGRGRVAEHAVPPGLELLGEDAARKLAAGGQRVGQAAVRADEAGHRARVEGQQLAYLEAE